jgi:hypothetical protein
MRPSSKSSGELSMPSQGMEIHWGISICEPGFIIGNRSLAAISLTSRFSGVLVADLTA